MDIIAIDNIQRISKKNVIFAFIHAVTGECAFIMEVQISLIYFI